MIRLNVTDEADRLLESHDKIGPLYVAPADVYGTGIIPAGSKGFFFWEPAWHQLPPGWTGKAARN
jgi:hypothetical protein